MHIEDVSTLSLLQVDILDIGLVVVVDHSGDRADVHCVPESSVDLIAADNVVAVIDPIR